MASENFDTNVFTQLGLTGVQAEVYIVLLRIGDTGAQAVAKYLHKDRAQVYRALSKLEEIGLIQKILAKPTRFRAISLDQVFQILINHQSKMLDRIKLKTDEFIDKFEINYKHLNSKDSPKYILILENEAHRKRVKELFSNLETSLDIIFNLDILQAAMNTYFEEYEKALKKGIKIRIITDCIKGHKIEETIQHFKEIGSIEVRKGKVCNIASIAIFDKKIVDIISSNDEDVKILRVTEKDISFSVLDYFELKWKSAEK